MGTWAVVRNREDRKLGFYSLNFEKLGIIESSLDELVPSKEAGWTNYPKGVMWAFEKRGYELTHGLDILIYGNIPNGSGLSSSASLEGENITTIASLVGFSSPAYYGQIFKRYMGMSPSQYRKNQA